jgi:hypothetical protein
MSLYVAEKEVVLKHKDALTGVNAAKSFIKFSDLNRLPLDVVEKIVRDSVAARRQRVAQGTMPTQAELLKLWDINEEAAAPPATTVKLPATKPAATMTDAINAMASTMRDAMYAAIDIATGTVPVAKGGAAKKSPARKAPSKTTAKPAARKAAKKPPAKTAPARKTAKKAAPARRK